MVALRARMEESFADWREDLPEELVAANGQTEAGWRTFFAQCPDPDFGSIPDALQIADNARAWPVRRRRPLQGAPEGAQICRAFEGIKPTGVQVVVLGQDPYPDPEQATGRAFEDGAWKDGRSESMAKSLKPLILAAIATQEGNTELFRAGSWPVVRRLIQSDHLTLPALGSYFDALVEQGVLFVNTAWTHTKPSDLGAHLSLWKPVLHHLLRKLSLDAQTPLIFVLLGKKAQARFSASGAEAEAERLGIWESRVMRVDLPHPRSSQFFGQNPWLRVNQLLVDLGARPVDWWPTLLPADPA